VTTITNEYMYALRAFLTGDPAFARMSERLEARDGRQGGDIYAALAGAAITVAARRQFGSGYTAADLIRFVAQARASTPGRGADIDPRTAEQLMRTVLGNEPAPEGLGQDAKARAVSLLLLELTSQQKMTGAELDIVLDKARSLAERALTEKA
jgi:hypothetical protein